MFSIPSDKIVGLFLDCCLENDRIMNNGPIEIQALNSLKDPPIISEIQTDEIKNFENIIFNHANGLSGHDRFLQRHGG